jgi:tetrahydromethanopterin S-methyltransferase subunit B
MTFLTDAEQSKLLDEEAGPITEKIRREVTRSLTPLKQKVAEHDSFILGFAKSLSTGFGAITSFTGKATGKR